MVLFNQKRTVMEGKVYVAKKAQEVITEKVITTILDLSFVKRLNIDERSELASFLK